ncbi:MAG: NUDIX domain-containing protein [Patescibacteria group bacterium]|nr:NUDIX domain-containing protein [Patescibacteria group bacterium]
MKKEISAGIIAYRKTKEGPKFLILYHGHDYWNFPKGKIESEEGNMAAAFREMREETGIASRDLHLANNFKVYERFSFRREGQPIFKIVIFYLAETMVETIKVSSEHQGYAWFLYNEARKVMGKHRDSQRVLRQAYEFLRYRRQPGVQSPTSNMSPKPHFTKRRPPAVPRLPVHGPKQSA